MNHLLLSSRCVYTIAGTNTLESAVRRSRPVRLTERKHWTTAHMLLEQARVLRQRLPILFGDAPDCACIFYWGILKEVELNPEEPRTTFVASRIRRLENHHAPQELILCSSRRA